MDFLKSRVRRIFYPPGTTPLKWKLFLNLFFSLFCSAISITILFPFLPAMVKSFGISDEDTGYYAGLVASSMFIGRTLACYFWGWLADKVGRRPVILLSLSLALVGMLAFGLSFSLYMAIFTRFFVGLANGLVGTCKAVASEACDNTNQAFGMSVVLTAWNMGLIVGPAVGGYLAQPAEKYPNVFPKGSFFDQFSFLLPCLFNCTIMIIAIVLDYFYLQETLVKSERESSASELPMQSTASSDNQDDSNKQLLQEGSEKSSCIENASSQEKEELEIIIRGDEDKKVTENWQSCCCCCCSKSFRCCKFLRNSKLAVLLRSRSVILAIATYCMLSLVIIGYDELFSLWAATEPHLGGLGFSTDQIGTALLCVAAPILFLQVWLYPKFERRVGAIRVFQFSSVVLGVTILSLSAINTFYNKSTILWPLLIGILLPMKLSTGCAFSSTAIFTNNSVAIGMLGSVNGLAMTAASLSRALAPVITGSAFAWSISEGFKLGFPLDEHFAFVILTFVCVLCILMACALPEGLNRRRIEAAKSMASVHDL